MNAAVAGSGEVVHTARRERARLDALTDRVVVDRLTDRVGRLRVGIAPTVDTGRSTAV